MLLTWMLFHLICFLAILILCLYDVLLVLINKIIFLLKKQLFVKIVFNYSYQKVYFTIKKYCMLT